MIEKRGTGASPGVAEGRLAYQRRRDERYIYVTRSGELHEDDRNDLMGARGVLILRGGMTADAAIVARALGIPCIINVPGLDMNEQGARVDATPFDGLVVLDGATGTVRFETVAS
jgi:pyruvate, orthophosphate dikinase